MEKQTNTKYFVKCAVILVCTIFVFVLLYSGIGCPFYRLFHLICPGCGMSRALIALFRFDFVSAFNYHPMVFSLPLLFFYFWFDGSLFKNKVVDFSILGLVIFGFTANYIIKLSEFINVGGY